MHRRKDFKGVTGVITLDEERNAVKPAVVLELQDKQFVYKETIYPEGMMSQQQLQRRDLIAHEVA